MAHIITPAIVDTLNISVWGFRLLTLNESNPRFRKLVGQNRVTDAAFSGSFEIPPQSSLKPEDPSIRGQLEIQTWFDGMMAGANSSVLPIKEPTIVIPENRTITTTDWTIVDNFLQVTTQQAGAGDPVAPVWMQLFKLGTPERIYRIAKVVGDVWTCMPGIEPVGALNGPRPVTDIIFKLTNQQEQRREPYKRGGWRGEFIEHIAPLGTII